MINTIRNLLYCVLSVLNLSFTGDFANNTYTQTGTVSDPIVISDELDLLRLSNDSSFWSKSFIQTQNILFNDPSTIDWNTDGLINELDKNGFNPIGSYRRGFQGNYNGNGNIIFNLFINKELSYAGLFGLLEGATIKNLGIENANIIGGKYTGILAGYADSLNNIFSTNITSCYVTGIISADGGPAGGLVGINNGNIENSYSNAAIYLLNGNTAGGLAGATYVRVVNSYSTGVVGKYATHYPGTHIIHGGFVAGNGGEIKNSYYDIETSTIKNYASSDTIYSISTEDFSSINFEDSLQLVHTPFNWNYLMNFRPILSFQKFAVKNGIYNNGELKIELFEHSNDRFTHGELLFRKIGDTLWNAVPINNIDSVINLSLNLQNPGAYYIVPAFYNSKGEVYLGSTIQYVEGFEGNGTNLDPYKLNSFEDFQILSNSPTLWHLDFLLMSDINFDSTVNFSPIGNAFTSFVGKFNGQGYTLRNVSINSNEKYVGFFGDAGWDAIIKNLYIKNCKVIAGPDSRVGALLGYFEGDSIEFIGIEGSITSDLYSEVGGLVGYMNGGLIHSSFF